MLQIKHRELLGGIAVILGWQIDVAVSHGLCHCWPIIDFVDRTLWHIVHSVEILVGSRNIDATTPTARTIKILASWIWNTCSVDIELIIVEALVLRSWSTSPDAVLIFCHLIDLTIDVKSDWGSGRGWNLGTNHALWINHGVLSVLLVGYCRLEVFNFCNYRWNSWILTGTAELGWRCQTWEYHQWKNNFSHNTVY